MFVIPGFGVAGLLGIAAILASLFLSFPDIWSALAAIGFAALFTVVGAVLHPAPGAAVAGLWRKLALETKSRPSRLRAGQPGGPGDQGGRGRAGFVAAAAGRHRRDRPVRIDAVSDGAFIEPGAAVEIVRVVGTASRSGKFRTGRADRKA